MEDIFVFSNWVGNNRDKLNINADINSNVCRVQASAEKANSLNNRDGEFDSRLLVYLSFAGY